jgi:hypothetical protein
MILRDKAKIGISNMIFWFIINPGQKAKMVRMKLGDFTLNS